MAKNQRDTDRRIIEASRAQLYDLAIVLHDLARRSPPVFAARLRLLVSELEDVAKDVEQWDTIATRYANPPPDTPPDR